MLSDETVQRLVRFRHRLHQHPEVSGKEEWTSGQILSALEALHPDRLLHHLGGYGVLCTFKGNHPGRHILVRVDMDGLPIQEENDKSYRSGIPHVSHTCGHDGHSTIGLAIAHMLRESPPEKGSTSILFQPAEETGEGARSVYEDHRFPAEEFDAAFGFHNIPGFSENEILVRDHTFACGSVGLIIRFKGRTSHAAEPERGNSPLTAMREFLNGVEDYQLKLTESSDFGLITVIHMKLGSENFGISPGEGAIMLTIRAETDRLLAELTERMVTLAQEAGVHRGLLVDHSTTDHFPTTVNREGFTALVKKSSRDLPSTFRLMEKPFRWSEDFGLFTGKYPGGMIGIGAGTAVPDLHNPNYDFPDGVISQTAALFYQLCRNIQHDDANFIH